MEYNSFLQKCNDDDVLELGNQIVKLSNFSSGLNCAFSWNYNKAALSTVAAIMKSPSLSNTNVQQLFNGDGIDASILCIGSQGWKKGKIKLKITLEFCPDEPEIEDIKQINSTENSQMSSPLDDIRQMMNKEN